MLPSNFCSIEEAFGVRAEADEQVLVTRTASSDKKRSKSRSSKKSRVRERERDDTQAADMPQGHTGIQTPVVEPTTAHASEHSHGHGHGHGHENPFDSLARDTVTQNQEERNLQHVWQASGVGDESGDGGWAHAVAKQAASRHNTSSPPASRYQAQFAKSPDPTRIPDGVEVALSASAAPFDTLPITSVEPTLGRVHVSNNTERAEPQPMDTKQMSPNKLSGSTTSSAPPIVQPPTATQAVDVHDELEWMRNNLSHLGDQIEQLTAVVRKDNTNNLSTRNTQMADVTDPTPWAQRVCDNILYLISGLFLLLALDIVYRAGCRSARRAS